MELKVFQELRQKLITKAFEVADSKNKEYAHSTDALANFKRNGERLGVVPEMVLAVYMNKHMDSIDSMVQKIVKTGQLNSETLSEPLDGRFIDAINYLILMYALMKERDDKEHGIPTT